MAIWFPMKANKECVWIAADAETRTDIVMARPRRGLSS